MAIPEGTGSNNPTGGSLSALLDVLRGLLGSNYDKVAGTTVESAINNIGRVKVLGIKPTRELEQAIPDAGPIREWYEHTMLGRELDSIEYGGSDADPDTLMQGVRQSLETDQRRNTPGEGDTDPRPEPDGSGSGGGDTSGGDGDALGGDDVTGASGGGTSSAGGGGTGGGGGTPTETESGGQRQIPGDMELWKVQNRHYLVTKIPGHNTPLAWKVENRERLNQLFDDNPVPDRELSHQQFVKRSPVVAGLSTEIQNVDGDPWQVFMHKWREETELRPWMDDPTFMAVAAEAYFEGREPTQDEISQTDWWNRSTADERAWMEDTVTLGSAEVKRRKRDASRTVAEALREAGMDNAPQHVVDFIATQRLTGRWSDTYTQQQVRKLTDPYASGRLDRGLKAALSDPQFGESGDARAISEGEDAVRERVRAIFDNRNVDLTTQGVEGEADPDARLNRIVQQIMNGERTFSDVRESVDWLATERADAGRPGGLDITREGEDNVRSLATRWLGPEVGNLPDDQVAEWAGRIRNNPDAEQEFIDHLRQQRLALLPTYENPNLTYEDIVSPVRNLATNVWGEPVQDETMLVDLANTGDYTEMSKRLRTEGLKRGVTKVKQDMLSGLTSTSLGNQVTRSAI